MSIEIPQNFLEVSEAEFEWAMETENFQRTGYPGLLKYDRRDRFGTILGYAADSASKFYLNPAVFKPIS